MLGSQSGIPEWMGGQGQERQSETQSDQTIWIALTPGLKLSSHSKHVTHSHQAGYSPLELLTLRSVYNVKNFTGNKIKI